MDPQIVFSYGLTKSGSTLAYQLVLVALERAGHPQPALRLPGVTVSRRINAIEHLDADAAARMRAAVAAHGHPVAFKTHTRPDPAVRDMVRAGALAHAVVRDPRDIALSMVDHGVRARAARKPAFAEIHHLDDALRGIDGQMETLAQWLALPGVRILRYDRLAFDTVAATAAILEHLGLDGDPQAIADEVLSRRFIQLNAGRRDRHRAEMSAADSARIRARYAPFYDLVLPEGAPPPPPGTPLTAPLPAGAR
ncbi:sulfotransferase domain-containing protein [Halovulum marinum]|nr:sulfotransferase domain-containing protein [Halovulum marinum]